MAICERKFKDIDNFRCLIIGILNKYIFKDSVKQLCLRYQDMEEHCMETEYYKEHEDEFEKKYTKGAGENKLELQIPFGYPYLVGFKTCGICKNANCLWSKFNLGHDLPVWINAGDKKLFDKIKASTVVETLFETIKQTIKNKTNKELNGKTVMLVGNDPERTDPSFQTSCIRLSSPWGVHSVEYRKRTSYLMWKFISKFVCDNKCNVYVTDRNKLYAADSIFNAKQIDNGRVVHNIGDTKDKVNMSMPSVHQPMIECLLAEIDFVQPEVLIFMGGSVDEFLLSDFCQTSYRFCQSHLPNTICLHVPHPAYGGWRAGKDVIVIE